MKPNHTFFSLGLIPFLLLVGSGCLAAAGAGTVFVGRFSQGTLDGWESKSFKGETRYALVEQGGRRMLRADSNGSASGLVRELRVDLEKTPYLNWSWRIENTLDNLDERSKSGDDYPARLYVVVSGGVAFWRTRAVNYVWASRLPQGREWPNAFAGDNAMMVAVRSGAGEAGRWVSEKRNVRADLKRLFGEDIRFIDAVALMTDTDNSGQRATAYYGDIFFSAQ